MEVAATDALRNDRYVNGENVTKFEEEFASMVGTRYAVATSSGTSALQFILMAVGIQNKRIFTSPLSFIASANSVLLAQGTPRFADISNESYCMDATSLANSPDVEGLLPVHIFGQPCDMKSLLALSHERNIPLVEDACQAHGASYDGKRVGSLGLAAAFSFYPSKNMTVLGDGGMITTNDADLAKETRKLHDSGRVSRYVHDVLGYNSRLNSVNAAIGRVQLRSLLFWNDARRRTAAEYNKRLSHISEVRLPRMVAHTEPVFHQFVILTSHRDKLKLYLESRGIECGIHYPVPIHLQPLYVKSWGYKAGMYPNSELFCRNCLSLPMHPFLTRDNIKRVCEAVTDFFSESQIN